MRVPALVWTAAPMQLRAQVRICADANDHTGWMPALMQKPTSVRQLMESVPHRAKAPAVLHDKRNGVLVWQRPVRLPAEARPIVADLAVAGIVRPLVHLFIQNTTWAVFGVTPRRRAPSGQTFAPSGLSARLPPSFRLPVSLSPHSHLSAHYESSCGPRLDWLR